MPPTISFVKFFVFVNVDFFSQRIICVLGKFLYFSQSMSRIEYVVIQLWDLFTPYNVNHNFLRNKNYLKKLDEASSEPFLEHSLVIFQIRMAYCALVHILSCESQNESTNFVNGQNRIIPIIRYTYIHYC